MVASMAQARSEPQVLRAAIARAFRSWWVTMDSIVAQDALASTLINHGVALLDIADAHEPMSVNMWLDDQVA